MRAYLKIAAVYLLRFALKAFYIFPIKKGRILFNSYGGKNISCNPKYIFLYLKKTYGNQYEYIWCLKNKEEREKSGSRYGVKTIPSGGIQYFYYTMTSDVYISNGIAPSYIPFRKQQCVIGTWHGGGAYKKGGIDVAHSREAGILYELSAQNVTYALSSCKKFSEVLQRSFLVDKDKILECGLPRNDLFFHNNRKKGLEMRQKLGICEDTKLLLYAPTFRSSFKKLEGGFENCVSGLNMSLLQSTLEEKFGGKWQILYRAHYFFDDSCSETDVIDVSAYPDMQEILVASDILITDYSSSIWDFALKRPICPCFIYAEDLERYLNDRGFETPISEWPFPLAKNNDELLNNILNFEYGQFERSVQKHLEDLGSFEKGMGCQAVGSVINERQ